MKSIVSLIFILSACTDGAHSEPDAPRCVYPVDIDAAVDAHTHPSCGPAPVVLGVQWNYTADPDTGALATGSLNAADYQRWRIWQDAVLAWMACHGEQTGI